MKVKEIRKKYEEVINQFLIQLNEIDREYDIFAEIEIESNTIHVLGKHFPYYIRDYKIDRIILNEETKI